MSWFYGLVKESDGKIRIWEIYEEEKYMWGHRGHISWMSREFIIVIKDLLKQRKYYRGLFDGKELEKGTKKQVKKWAKEVKKTMEKLTIK